MHRSCSRLFRFALVLLTLATASVQAQSGPFSSHDEISPKEARRAIEVLSDEASRTDVLVTLEAIAASPAPAEQANDVERTAPVEAASETTPEPEPVIMPLERDGLIARMLNQLGSWANGLGEQLGQVRNALLEYPNWFDVVFKSQAGRALLGNALIVLALVFSLGLATEWGMRQLLRRPRTILVEHERQTEKHERITTVSEAQSPDVVLDAEHAPVIAGTQPRDSGVALVQTLRDGVEQVEAVLIGSSEQPAAGADASDNSAHKSVADAVDSVSRHRVNQRSHLPDKHRSALRHLPSAIGLFSLDLIPLALFFCVAALAIHWYPDLGERSHDVVLAFVNAYLFTRLSMALVRLLVSPTGYGLQVFQVSSETSRLLKVWIRYLVVLTAFGIATADALQTLGAGAAGWTAIMKLVSLLVHLMLIALIFRLHRPVRRFIAPEADSSGPFAILRQWLARVWTIPASVFIMGLWVVWALGVENGFPKLVEFIAVTGIILIFGRLLSMLALGALERSFAGSRNDSSNEVNQDPDGLHGRLAEQLFPWVRGLLLLIITAGVLIALLEAWGVDAIAWFAAGTIGRGLTEAILTILIAVILALVVWQLGNAALERRIARLSEKGEVMRAARLSTLFPMLRSSLLIMIVLIVGLTVLSEVGINTGPLLAGASIIGVALGFGSQKLVQDFITGIFLLMENAMQVGDWVTVAGVSGTVEKLSIRTVRLRAGDGSLHIVPFSSVTTVNNTNRGIGNAALKISVGYDTDMDQAVAELNKIGAELRADPAFGDLIIDDLAIWGVDSVDGSMVTLVGQMRCVDKGRWGVQRELNRRIFERFRELGIQVADPRERLMVPKRETQDEG